ncbi:MAG: NAD-dependent DNA ligase [Alphaproteobacteria bacterium]|nr:NAD-dependent DNA ligase [Alphaproteobacteria bacterium]
MVDNKTLRRYSKGRLEQRQIDELIGLAAGISADNIVNQAEAEFLLKWLEGYSDIVNENPLTRPILVRLREMLADNILDDDEKEELLELLKKFSGNTFEEGEIAHATTLPLNNPPPNLNFEGTQFCFTGQFYFGARKNCEKRTIACGGISGTLTKATDYLVIGTYVTETWKHASYGRKIMKAVEMKEKGHSIAIIDEVLWRDASDAILGK